MFLCTDVFLHKSSSLVFKSLSNWCIEGSRTADSWNREQEIRKEKGTEGSKEAAWKAAEGGETKRRRRARGEEEVFNTEWPRKGTVRVGGKKCLIAGKMWA